MKCAATKHAISVMPMLVTEIMIATMSSIRDFWKMFSTAGEVDDFAGTGENDLMCGLSEDMAGVRVSL